MIWDMMDRGIATCITLMFHGILFLLLPETLLGPQTDHSIFKSK